MPTWATEQATGQLRIHTKALSQKKKKKKTTNEVFKTKCSFNSMNVLSICCGPSGR
jgi:hypothetical protein